MIFNSIRRRRNGHPACATERSLRDLRRGEHGVLDRLDLPDEISQRLMELGFLPGAQVTVAHSAPAGGPTVYRVDGSEIALRKETACKLYLRPEKSRRGAAKQ